MRSERNPYLHGDDIIVIIHEDCTGRKLEKTRVSTADGDAMVRVFQSILDKYGVSVTLVKGREKKIDWLEEDKEFKWS